MYAQCAYVHAMNTHVCGKGFYLYMENGWDDSTHHSISDTLAILPQSSLSGDYDDNWKKTRDVKNQGIQEVSKGRGIRNEKQEVKQRVTWVGIGRQGSNNEKP